MFSDFWEDGNYFLRECGFLLWRAKLEELLYHIIPKDVGHQGIGGGENFLENELLLAGRGAFQLLLDESRAVLVLAELHYVVGEIAQL